MNVRVRVDGPHAPWAGQLDVAGTRIAERIEDAKAEGPEHDLVAPDGE